MPSCLAIGHIRGQGMRVVAVEPNPALAPALAKLAARGNLVVVHKAT